jgi:hypothetical protein
MQIENLEEAYNTFRQLLAVKASFIRRIDLLIDDGTARNHIGARVIAQEEIAFLEEKLKSLGVEL